MPTHTKWRLALATVLALVLVAPATASSGSVPESRASKAEPKHRIVWDEWKEGRNGIHLRAANEDGTGLTRVYDRKNGFTTDLHVDPTGKRVAFATCCSDSIPAMIVVSLDGKKVLRPLAHHRKIAFVGAIGWSPDGRRLAFEGTVRRGEKFVKSLWTVRPNGSDLRRVATKREAYDSHIGIGLGWSKGGIVYTDGRDLYIAKGGRSRRVLRDVSSVLPAGNGRRLLVYRPGSETTWLIAPDGTHRQRVDMPLEDGVLSYTGARPDRTGRELLMCRTWRLEGSSEMLTDYVAWRVSDGRERELVGPNSAMSLTWY